MSGLAYANDVVITTPYPPIPPHRPKTFYASQDFLNQLAMDKRLKDLKKNDLTTLTAAQILKKIEK